MPDKTTVAEALNHIQQIYGYDTDYILEYLVAPEAGAKIFNKKTGSRLRVTLNLFGTDWTQPYPIVTTIEFVIQNASLTEFFALLGDPDDVILAPPDNAPQLALSYKKGIVYAFVPTQGCNKIDINQMMNGLVILMYGHVPTNYPWLSKPVPWRGLGVCHSFRK